MLHLHRERNPDGPFQPALCQSPSETPSGRWDCAPAKVHQLHREAAAMRRAVHRAWLARHSHEDLIWHWAGVAQCESGGDPTTNTGNGYYGAYQFLLSTWHSVGGSGYPHQNSLGEQSYRADLLRQRSGLGQWPVCGRYYR